MSPEITSKVQKLSPGDRKVALETGIGWKVIFFAFICNFLKN